MSDNALGDILIIDNDEAVVRTISTRLESVGYRCRTANTGAQGLTQYSLSNVDLIITDLNMPVLDGVGFVEKIRKFSMVHIIIITGFRQEYDDRLTDLPRVTILQKPFDTNVLLGQVESELAMRPAPLAQRPKP